MRSLPGKLLIHFIFHQGGNKLMTKEEFRKLTEQYPDSGWSYRFQSDGERHAARHLYRDLGY